MLKRNIIISYILSVSKYSWFWLGIWVFYYLRFTNYAGIGIIETVLIVTMTLAEVPTGAIADLLGKKRTLIISFLLESIGGLIMAFSGNFEALLLSVFIMCVGGAFYSGTIDALVYDTLKQDNKESSYDKIISNLSTISLITPAICGVLGGFMYTIDPRFPFLANAVGYFVGLIASFFLIEPFVDTVKFSFHNYLLQTKQGLKELFKSNTIQKQTSFLLIIGFFVVIASEMLDGFLALEFGFIEEQQGILWAAIFIIAALVSQLTPLIKRRLSGDLSSIFVGVVIAITFLVSPYIGIIFGGLSLVLRTSFEGIFGNLSSVIINNNTESKYRATTISTFNMIKNVPYVLSAYLVGSFSDVLSAKKIAFYLGLSLMVVIAIQILTNKLSNTKFHSDNR